MTHLKYMQPCMYKMVYCKEFAMYLKLGKFRDVKSLQKFFMLNYFLYNQISVGMCIINYSQRENIMNLIFVVLHDYEIVQQATISDLW